VTRYHEQVAELRCSIAALAVERYRLGEGRWPTGLAELVPRYLASVPVDPFSGQPLQLKPFEEGIAITSIGGSDGTPIPFHLWDVERRGQGPAK
jgi:hypothetical protein